jgi:GntR family transcriptional regulator
MTGYSNTHTVKLGSFEKAQHRMSAESAIYGLVARIDPSSRVPLYEQLARLIHQGIANKDLEPGALLPREQEFSQYLGLSRQTVNQPLSSLARRGLVTRRRGVATFVTEAYAEPPPGHSFSFLNALVEQGRFPAKAILGYRVTVDERASPLLSGQPNGLLFELQRLRLVDDEPVAIETSYLPRSYGQSLPLDRLTREPLYDLLNEVCGLRVTKAEETVSLCIAAEPDASLIGLPAGSAAFLVERIAYADTQPVEFRHSLVRGDRFRFQMTLTGLDNRSK